MDEKKLKQKISKNKWIKNNPDKRREYKRRYAKKYPDRVYKQNKKYREINKDKVRDARMKLDYGISLNDYNILLLKQNHKCAICKLDETQTMNGLYIDHCHKTNKIRGLLCQKCNSGLGFLQDDVLLVKEALKYLLKK